MENVTLKNRSGDQKYFVMTPELVRAMCDVYEQSLWGTIKMICGPDGACEASAALLAELSKMSVGKVCLARKSLVAKGLLEGGPIDPNNYQSRWTLTVPDIWEENVKVRKAMGDSLHARARAYGKLQWINLSEIRKKISSLHEDFSSWSEELISSNSSLHEENSSPHEETSSPHEENSSPHEEIKNQHKRKKGNKLGVNLGLPSSSPHEIKYNIKLKPSKKNENGEKTTHEFPVFWKRIEATKKWWDEKAIATYTARYGWHPGDLCTGLELEQLLKHADRFGMEVLEAKYEDYLRQDNKFFTKNHHPISLFVKCIGQFSGEKKEMVTLEDENAEQFRAYLELEAMRKNGTQVQRQTA